MLPLFSAGHNTDDFSESRPGDNLFDPGDVRIGRNHNDPLHRRHFVKGFQGSQKNGLAAKQQKLFRNAAAESCSTPTCSNDDASVRNFFCQGTRSRM